MAEKNGGCGDLWKFIISIIHHCLIMQCQKNLQRYEFIDHSSPQENYKKL